MRPKTFEMSLQVDADGIAASQTLGSAGDLTLNGALISNGEYSHTTAQQVGITSAGNVSAVNFTVYGVGYDSNGLLDESLSETIAGPNANTVETSVFFKKVTRVAADAAVASAVTVGPVDEAVSQPIVLDYYDGFPVTLDVTLSTGATINYDAEYTARNVFNATSITWKNHDTLVGQTASATGNITAPVYAVRFAINSGANGDTLTGDVMSESA